MTPLLQLTDPFSKRMSQMRLKKMSQMRLKKMSQMRLKRPSYMRLRRGPSMMRLKKSSPEAEVDCVWVRGICIDSAEVELLNQVQTYMILALGVCMGLGD